MSGYFNRLMEMSGPDQIHDSSLNYFGKKNTGTDLMDANSNRDFKGHEKDIVYENRDPVKPRLEFQKEGVDVSVGLQKNKELNFNDSANLHQGNQSRHKNKVLHSNDQTDLHQGNQSRHNTNRFAMDDAQKGQINVMATSPLLSSVTSFKKYDNDAKKTDYQNKRNKNTITNMTHELPSLIKEQINEGQVKDDLPSENIISKSLLSKEQNMSIDDSLDIKDQVAATQKNSMSSNISTKDEKAIYNYLLDESANSSDATPELDNSQSNNPDLYDNINVTIGSIIFKINGNGENESYTNQTSIQSNSERNHNAGAGILRRYYMRSRLR